MTVKQMRADEVRKGDVVEIDGTRSTVIRKPWVRGGHSHGTRMALIATNQADFDVPASSLVTVYGLPVARF